MPEPTPVIRSANDPRPLAGRMCIVTGAGNGIGQATALRLAEAGGTVIAADIDGTAAEATARLTPEATVFGRSLDVSDRTAFATLIDETVAEHGRVDVLVNNAAVNRPALFHEASEADIDRTIAVNIRGALNGCQLVIPGMLEHGGGSIINVASVNALVAERFLSIYAMSKGALTMLSRGIALDYAGSSIRCNVVCPGWIDTPFNDAHANLLRESGVADDVGGSQPMGRAGRPAEIAGVIAFLAGDEASFMTGSVVIVDGGMTVQ